MRFKSPRRTGFSPVDEANDGVGAQKRSLSGGPRAPRALTAQRRKRSDSADKKVFASLARALRRPTAAPGHKRRSMTANQGVFSQLQFAVAACKLGVSALPATA